MGAEHIFYREIAPDTYLISTSEYGPNEDGTSLCPGKATTNSYLLVGKECAVLFDLAVNEPEMYQYARKLAQKEVMLVVSHGHYDHMYYLQQRSNVWIHPEDEVLLRKGMSSLKLPPIQPCPRLHYLMRDDIISLGERELKVIHIPGHTPGSILLLDEKNRILFSGDTVARRLLFGVSGEVDEKKFCENLEQLKGEAFDVIYSAHDRCALPKEHLDLMLDVIRGGRKAERTIQEVPSVGTFVTLNFGLEKQLEYFNVAWMKSESEADEP